MGLLTPSGIYADRTAARFFQSVSTTGRVAGIYDFENRKIFFKDIHASFKFCALIVGGPQRTFPETRCGFFLPGTDTINDPTEPSPSRLTTSPASTPTPAPRPSSALAATLISPAVSTNTTPSSSTAPATTNAASGPSATSACWT